MMHSVFYWLRRASARRRAARNSRTFRPRRFSVPQLAVLEDRTVLSVLTVLNSADSGAGSLRDTLAGAQSGDTIVFDPSLMYETITLTSGPLALSNNLMIEGPGANLLAISGNNAGQLFTLSGNAKVTLANLTLTGGMSSQGGAVFIGGSAALTLDSDTLSANQAVGDAQKKAMGGAVFNSAGGILTIDNTVFVNNQTNAILESFGGAIANAGTLTIDGVTFTGNEALGSTTPAGWWGGSGNPAGGNLGGAILNLDGSTATIQLSTFSGNQAMGIGAGDAGGGAICNGDVAIFPFTGSGVTATVSQCTSENNTAEGGSHANHGAYGGAIANNPGVNLTVLNCSFTSNQANTGGGPHVIGGAIADSVAVSGTISDSQFIDNSAVGSGIGAEADGGAVDNYQTMTIANSLFTGNSAVGGPMADGVNTFGNALGGAIFTGIGLSSGVMVSLTLSNSIVADNEAIGGPGASTVAYPRTGGAAGGGIDNAAEGTLNIAGCTITGNQAVGGASAQGIGSPVVGGGIDNNNRCTLNLKDSTVSFNICQAGAGASGYAGGVAAGAGIGNDRGSTATVTNCTISMNECLGGAGGAGASGGGAAGAGIENGIYSFAFGLADASSLTVTNCAFFGNMAQGGTAGSDAVGGDGLGGGLFMGSGTVALKVALVSGNQSQGGSDGQGNTTGQGLGGGVYVEPSSSATADMQTLIAGNQASKDKNDVWGTLTIVP
jgi:hypothetical protein